MRELAYYEAKFEALRELLAADERVHLIGGTFLSLSPRKAVFQEIAKRYPIGSSLLPSQSSASAASLPEPRWQGSGRLWT